MDRIGNEDEGCLDQCIDRQSPTVLSPTPHVVVVVATEGAVNDEKAHVDDNSTDRVAVQILAILVQL